MSLDVIRAASVQTDPLISGLLGGVQNKWYGLLVKAAGQYVKGQDVLDVANQVAAEVVGTLTARPEGNNFVENIDKIVNTSDGDDRARRMTAFFEKDARQRARRIGLDQFAKGKVNQTVKFSTLGKSEKSDMVNFPDQSEAESAVSETQGLAALVLAELDAMQEACTHKARKPRFAVAKAAARIRMENAPEPVPLDELLNILQSEGFKIGRSQLNEVLKDVQEAFYRVAVDNGMEDISTAIDSIRARKAS